MKAQIKNIVFIVVIALLLVPQTRKLIQVFVNKGLALISPSIKEGGENKKLLGYDYNFVDKNNTVFNLEATKGKVVLINYWATWCPPCIAEMPSLQKLYADYRDKITFVFITSDGFNEVDAFLNEHGYTFNVYREMDDVFSKTLQINGIPRTLLVDKTGAIVIDETGAANWNSSKVRRKIDDLLAK